MKKERYLSIDVLRGLIVFVMILVNSPGSWQYVYKPLTHVKWAGCALTDLVFPGFIFVMGISMSISFPILKSTVSNRTIYKRIVKRALVIFTIGVLLNGFPYTSLDFYSYRVLGVLQRIALSFLVAAIMIVYVKKIKLLWVISLFLMLLHWCVLCLFGGENPYSLESNFSAAVDVYLLGVSHLYQGYGVPYDPEGLLGVLSSTSQVIFGYLLGSRFVKLKRRDLNPVWSQCAIFGFMMLIGLIWSKIYPINKPLWTGSYVLFSTGVLGFVWMFIVQIIQIKFIRERTTFFKVFGLNPLFSYVLSHLIMSVFILPVNNGFSIYKALYKFSYQPLFGSYLGSFCLALSFTLLIWFATLILYKNKIVIKI